MYQITLESLRYMSGSHIVLAIDWETDCVTGTHIERDTRLRPTSHDLGSGPVEECWYVINDFNALGYREVHHDQPTNKALFNGLGDGKEHTPWRHAPLSFEQWRQLGYEPLLLRCYWEGFYASVNDAIHERGFHHAS